MAKKKADENIVVVDCFAWTKWGCRALDVEVPTFCHTCPFRKHSQFITDGKEYPPRKEAKC